MNGVFPRELKYACVVPIYKGDDSSKFNNYRPVSVLPVFSKIIERLMYDRLLLFLNQRKLLWKYQFGFREKHSTNLALILLMDKITSAIENGEYVLWIFLDFSKAFDTVNHKILLDIFNFYDVRGIANTWFQD